MNEPLLELRDLEACVEEKQILQGVNMTIGRGEIHVLMGPNGAGKSTLGHVLMGSPRYTVTKGSILFKGQDITHEKTDQRAKLGMFLSFQDPLEVPGLPLDAFLKTAVEARTGTKIRFKTFRQELEQAMELLQMPRAYAQRSLNTGFSGGEKKKAEILQLLMLKPDLAILDETDSGLDVDAVRVVSAGIDAYMKQNGGSLLIITHSTRILDQLKVDRTHVEVSGRIIAEGDGSLVQRINEGGYESFVQAEEAHE